MSYFEHTIGSHSDDRGGESDVLCFCNKDTPTPADDWLDDLLIDFGMNCYDVAKNIANAVPSDLKTLQVKQAILAHLKAAEVAARKEAFIAGALYGGIPEEDVSIILAAFNVWTRND